MPPKVKYSKEQIVEAAFSMVRKYGEGILSARNIAAELGCSTAPIFTAFSSIEELRAAVFERAYELYEQYAGQLIAVQVWGTVDDLSWRADEYPLLFDNKAQPKPAAKAAPADDFDFDLDSIMAEFRDL